MRDALAPSEALKLAVKVVGGQSAAARIIGIRQQSVSEVLRRGGAAPAEWCIPLERATKAAGQTISRHQLRLDVYPIEDAKSGARA